MGKVLLEVAAFANVLQAWDSLKGRLRETDRLSFGWQIEENLLALGDALIEGTYQPVAQPVAYHFSHRGREIPVPALKDRLVLRALKQVLLPRMERSFIYDTYSGIVGRGVHRAVTRVMDFQRRVAPPRQPRSGWILKADVRNFYPSVRHEILQDQ